MISCPLCHCQSSTCFCEHKTGEYRRCSKCSLVFVLPREHLSAKDEKERYDLHTNSCDDPGYRKYLKKVLDPVCERVEKGSFGLDFGSGPGPALSKMFEESGYAMSIYDHYYAKDEEVLKKKYDFITSTEVIEHLYDPNTVMDKLWNMLKEEGLLVFLTQPYVGQNEFLSWYYKNDPTHVCFFNMETMKWLEKKWDASLEVLGEDLFLFKKRATMGIDFEALKTPVYICELKKLEDNLKILDRVQKESGAKVILALKGFAMHATFDLVGQYLQGCTASGLHEAKLAREKMNKEVHTYSPAFKEDDIEEIASISDHIVFNSPSQLLHFHQKVKTVNPDISISLRVNPECSSSPVDLYNPCAAYSRLGTTKANLIKANEDNDKNILEYVEGLNFHALCEQQVDALEGVIRVFEEKFGEYIDQMKYINFGGGHHITKKGYDVDRLIEVIKAFKARHNNIEVYLEPGEAVGWETGVLVASVLDIIDNGMKLAILDTSAEAHMPDTLAMPYRADVRGSAKANEKAYTYRFGGNTCLAGDIMGDYSFDKELKVGDKIIFEDQIHYTFVKNTTFNGIPLPSLAVLTKENELRIVKEFGYIDYKERLS